MGDKELLQRFGLSEQYVQQTASQVEDEAQSDELTDNVLWSPTRINASEVTTISLRLPKDLAERLTADAKLYGITRSEYIRRKLSSL